MVQEITPEGLHQLNLGNEDYVLIDVLKEEMFRKQHLPQAISIPLDTLEDTIGKVARKERKVIVYCYDADCHASDKAAEKLEELGYTNVHDLAAGIEGWKEAGYPVHGI